MTRLSHDYEWMSDVPIDQGLDRYFAGRMSRPLLYAYRFDDGPVRLWDVSEGLPFPKEVDEALLDPHVEKHGFNNAFERLATQRRLGRKIDPAGWRCTMALAYSQSFTGTLGDVGAQIGLPADKQKDARGKKLIRLFTQPQRPTKNQPHVWCDWRTHPAEWEEFRAYCCQDVEAEDAIRQWLARFPMADSEWRLYELDQRINDAGLPMDMRFVENAIKLSDARKAELLVEMRDLTRLDNPNSIPQLLGWLRERGYPFKDVKKDTVVKVLNEDALNPVLTDEAREALRLRQNSARMAVAKYDAIVESIGADGLLRNTFQFNGASRTGRFAGRKFQPTNLVRTPKMLENEVWLDAVTDAIRAADADLLALLVGEPLDALAGCVRSAVKAPEDMEFCGCDLNAIESRVIGWLCGCERLLDVFRQGRDPYKDFATVLFNVPYEAVTGRQRNDSKPAVLGAGYRLGGGALVDGMKTGLWGYAEKMGIDLSLADAERAVRVFRNTYVEIVKTWTTLERAAERCLETGTPQSAGRWLRFERSDDYLMLVLPSGRRIHYHKPELATYWFAKHPETGAIANLGTDEKTAKRREENGYEVWSKQSVSYMGRPQNKAGWVRIPTHGGRFMEQATQATARDVLKVGMLRAARDGFDIRLHVYDEIVTMQAKGHNYLTPDRLADHMTRPIKWAPGLPLKAKPVLMAYYRKD